MNSYIKIFKLKTFFDSPGINIVVVSSLSMSIDAIVSKQKKMWLILVEADNVQKGLFEYINARRWMLFLKSWFKKAFDVNKLTFTKYVCYKFSWVIHFSYLTDHHFLWYFYLLLSLFFLHPATLVFHFYYYFPIVNIFTFFLFVNYVSPKILLIYCLYILII